MLNLLSASLIWAFSFGLIKRNLTELDSSFIAFIRLLLSLILFLPFMRLKGIKPFIGLKLYFIGMVQFGLMYILYIYSYNFLEAYQVALFTIFTPLYVTLINDIIRKRFHFFFFLASIIAVIGTGVIVYKKISYTNLQFGFLILQFSNICFAAGQILYKKVMQNIKDYKDHKIFALLYLGGVSITALSMIFKMNLNDISISQNQILTLIYLGFIASGVGFFLWNFEARKTNVGMLSILNNAKIPLAIFCSLLFFNETANILRVVIGSLIIFSALGLNDIIVRKINTNNMFISSRSCR